MSMRWTMQVNCMSPWDIELAVTEGEIEEKNTKEIKN